MFCSKCGKEIPDNSTFCPQCGESLGGESKKEKFKVPSIDIDVDFNSIGSFMLESIKNPVSACKKVTNNLAKPVLIGYFFGASILIGLLVACTTTVLVTNIFNFILKLSGNTFGMNASDAMLFQMFKSKLLPFGKVFLWTTLAIIIYYLLIMLSMVIINAIVNKDSIDLSKYFLTASVAITIQLMFTVLAVLFAFINIGLAVGVLTISGFINQVILYNGYSYLTGEKNFFIYALAIIVTVVSMIVSVFVGVMVYSHFENLSSELYSNPFNSYPNTFNPFY